MGKHNRAKRRIIWIILPLLALTATGCFITGEDVVVPTPMFTPVPTQTAPPTPLATATPVPPPTPTPLPRYQCAIDWRWIEPDLVITSVRLDKADGLQPNDKVLTIDGRPAIEVIVDAEARITGDLTPEKRRELALNDILYGPDLIILFIQHHNESPYFYNLDPDCPG